MDDVPQFILDGKGGHIRNPIFVSLSDASPDELADTLIRATMKGCNRDTVMAPRHFVDVNGFDWGVCTVRITRA